MSVLQVICSHHMCVAPEIPHHNRKPHNMYPCLPSVVEWEPPLEGKERSMVVAFPRLHHYLSWWRSHWQVSRMWDLALLSQTSASLMLCILRCRGPCWHAMHISCSFLRLLSLLCWLVLLKCIMAIAGGLTKIECYGVTHHCHIIFVVQYSWSASSPPTGHR